MKRYLLTVLAIMVLPAAVACFGGCASQKEIAGHWRGAGFIPNGRDEEWQNDTPGTMMKISM